MRKILIRDDYFIGKTCSVYEEFLKRMHNDPSVKWVSSTVTIPKWSTGVPTREETLDMAEYVRANPFWFGGV
jgi:hypothetical protein